MSRLIYTSFNTSSTRWIKSLKLLRMLEHYQGMGYVFCNLQLQLLQSKLEKFRFSPPQKWLINHLLKQDFPQENAIVVSWLKCEKNPWFFWEMYQGLMHVWYYSYSTITYFHVFRMCKYVFWRNWGLVQKYLSEAPVTLDWGPFGCLAGVDLVLSKLFWSYSYDCTEKDWYKASLNCHQSNREQEIAGDHDHHVRVLQPHNWSCNLPVGPQLVPGCKRVL